MKLYRKTTRTCKRVGEGGGRSGNYCWPINIGNIGGRGFRNKMFYRPKNIRTKGSAKVMAFLDHRADGVYVVVTSAYASGCTPKSGVSLSWIRLNWCEVVCNIACNLFKLVFIKGWFQLNKPNYLHLTLTKVVQRMSSQSLKGPTSKKSDFSNPIPP